VLQEIRDAGHGFPAFLFNYSFKLGGEAILITIRVKIEEYFQASESERMHGKAVGIIEIEVDVSSCRRAASVLSIVIFC